MWVYEIIAGHGARLREVKERKALTRISSVNRPNTT